jgi:hypothetical protein
MEKPINVIHFLQSMDDPQMEKSIKTIIQYVDYLESKIENAKKELT